MPDKTLGLHSVQEGVQPQQWAADGQWVPGRKRAEKSKCQFPGAEGLGCQKESRGANRIAGEKQS